MIEMAKSPMPQFLGRVPIWLASLFGPGMNWLNVLITEGQVDHGIAASSPIFRNNLESDKTGSLLR